VRESEDSQAACLVGKDTRAWRAWCTVVLGCLLQGCGLLMDAAQVVRPVIPELPDEVDMICRHRRLQVGIAVEPFPPFVFPVVWTDEGPRVTGLEIELVNEITAALSKYCEGSPVTAVVHVVHFRDLFLLLNEGHLDLFVSSVGYNVPHPSATGLAFSSPYFYEAGITGATRRPEVLQQVLAVLRQPLPDEDPMATRKRAFTGLTVAAQAGRSPYVFAEAELKGVRLVACDTFLAAFESQDPPVDIILGKHPILDFYIKHDRPAWQPLVLEDGQPLLLTREFFTVMMGEAHYRLQWLVNNVVFQLEQSGRLTAMHHRWFDDNYAYIERARTEGLLSTAEKGIHGNDNGRCRWARR
jgi:polar amino acid transport system substrate-binding protein